MRIVLELIDWRYIKGGFVVAVQKYTAKNGKTLWRFSVWYTDWTGTRKRKKQEGFKTQREAKEAETTFVNSKRTDIDITFGNLVKVYFENRSARIEKTTLATKEHMIRTKILPYFENLPLSEIDTAAVMKWQTELMNYRNPKNGQSIRTDLSTANPQSTVNDIQFCCEVLWAAQKSSTAMREYGKAECREV